MESLGDWSWPGVGGAAAEVLPPSWVPAMPPRAEAARAASRRGQAELPRSRARRLLLGALLSALATVLSVLALSGPASIEGLLGHTAAVAPVAVARIAPAALVARPAPLPHPRIVSRDSAGSVIELASYPSPMLTGRGSFHVYLPPGYAPDAQRYPVLYLLHGNNQQATAFLQVGLQGELDRLIARHAIPPLIAVMIQGGGGANNWRDWGRHRYESYVLEVQTLTDRLYSTIAGREGRAIAGDSMGGYGAMNVALGNPYRFGVVESWLGFFDGLQGQLRADRQIISRLGLHAFVYGAASDHIASPHENAPFAAALRSVGANAGSAVYPGEHSLQTVEAHLGSMLAFAGGSLAQGNDRRGR